MSQAIVVVDSQKLNTIMACARKYDFTFNQLLEPVVKAEALERGDLLHKLMETYYKLIPHRSRWAQNGHSHEDIINICKRVGDHHAIKMSLDLDECELVKWAFTEYARHYQDEDINVLAVEQTGSRILHEDEDIKIIYETKIDLIIRLKNMPMIWVDHKSSKRNQDPTSLSNQFIGYSWMLGINNGIVNKVGFQKTLPAAQKFVRTTLSFPADVIEEWRESAVWWIKLLHFFTQNGFYPPNFTSCDKYSGCIYRALCETERRVRPFKAVRDYVKREKPWDVGADL